MTELKTQMNGKKHGTFPNVLTELLCKRDYNKVHFDFEYLTNIE